MRFISFIFCLLFFQFSYQLWSQEDAFQEFKVKRKEIFEFAKKPELTRTEKNATTITFTSKDYCDVTVAIETLEGKIVRHLASGVLGSKVPAPLLKNSLEQTIVWDHKDDAGKYVDNLEAIRVRVSLGLQAEYEKDLYYSPYKRISVLPVMAAAPEGIYVFEGCGRDHLRLFDHDGNYVRTIYPFPASQLKNVKGLNIWKAPDGSNIYDKEGLYYNTLLTSGENDCRTDQKGRQGAFGAIGLAVKGNRISLVYEHLNRLSTDGSSGGFLLKGPETGIKISKGGYGGQGTGAQIVGPSSAAFSPDGKTLYMTGYHWQQRAGTKTSSLMAVQKINYETDEEATTFAGVKSDSEIGDDEKHFCVPSSVDTDKNGNVYVSDFGNDRVQIFDSKGKLLKSIPVKYPAKVAVHQKTGEIYVFSWPVIGLPIEVDKRIGDPYKIPQKIVIYSAFPEVAKKQEDDFSFGPYTRSYIFGMGQMYQLTLDSWTEEPSFWVAGRKQIPGPDDMAAGGLTGMDVQTSKFWEGGARKVQLKKGKWEVVFDVTDRAKQDLIRLTPPRYNIQQLYFNPKSEKLYVGEPDSAPTGKAWTELIEIEPNTGKTSLIKLPINPQDMAFDLNGLIYLRTMNVLTRYDMNSWKEVPFDYGSERQSVGRDGGIGGVASPVISAIMLPAKNAVCYHQGGMSVNVNGDIAVACHSAKVATKNTEFKSADIDETAVYNPAEYPGRLVDSKSVCVHIWDKFGNMKYDDVVKGSPQTDGVVIDKDNNLYMLATPPRLINGKPIDYGMSSTLIKFGRESNGKFLSTADHIPLALDKSNYPKRPQELRGMWVENYEWMYGGCGFGGFNGAAAGGGCACWFVRFKLDYYARSFVPEPMQYSVAVLDSSGNLILKIGKYGNEDSKGKNSKEPLGGDEVGLFHPCFVEVHSDRRLFIADIGNENIMSVKLKYAAEEILSFNK